VPVLIAPLQWWSSEYRTGRGFAGKISRYLSWRTDSLHRLGTNLHLTPQISRQLKAWNVDILYSNSSVIPVGAILALRMGKPHVWHLREFGTLDYGLTFDWGMPLFEFLLRQADAQICVSKAIHSFYSNGLAIGKSYVVYNGVATEEQIERMQRSTSDIQNRREHFVFALIGLIHENKGQDTAIRALSLLKDSLPSTRLVIAGDNERKGKDIKRLRELAASLGVEGKVSFPGYVVNTHEVYRQADAVLMCSRHEAMGRVTVEAMTASKPVIGLNSGGTSEIIEHEGNGLLYKGGAEELALCMRRFVEDPMWACQLGENGWRQAKNKYSIEAYAGSIYEILSCVMKGRERKNGHGGN